MFRNALVSCSDKSGLVDFLRPLQAKGMRIVSTGGTAKELRNSGLKVDDVSTQTGFPEVMDGRVKTLHPKIHMGLLGRPNLDEDQNSLKQYGVEMFDLVVGNLYPFENEPGIETIDVGGPSFLRAAAKNHEFVTVVCDPNDYTWLLAQAKLTIDDRRRLAAKVFAHTASYDAMISQYLGREQTLKFPDNALGGAFVRELRYGENPQQQAAWFRIKGEENGLHSAKVLQGKELSYNNILDLDAAVRTVRGFHGQHAAVAVKHNSPCGVAVASTIDGAVEKCIAADPQSIFGGIVALTHELSEGAAKRLGEIFLECVVAPTVSEGAKKVLASKKNLRVLEWPEILVPSTHSLIRTVAGGYLVQSPDQISSDWSTDWKVRGQEPKGELKQDLLTAWKVVAQLKSNAIAIVGGGQTLGLGMGQVNRVDAVEHAIQRYRRFHASFNSAVLASDAFFPFADSIEKIAAAGIRWVVQPGGSVRDDEVFARAEELGVNLVLTGTRHFLH